MRAPTGNMASVYAEFWRMQEIADEVEPEINQAVRATAAMEAEITEGASADWYLVNTYPGDDVRAMRNLARRRFGVFRPMQQRTEPHREGQPLGGMEPVFPGWLFVLTWGIAQQQSRLCGCPGVMDILHDPVSLRPQPVPHWFVHLLREKSWVYNENIGRVAQEAERHERRQSARRPSRQERKLLNRLHSAVKIDNAALERLRMGVESKGITWDESTWGNINRLEPHERIALLTWTLMPPVAG